MTLFARAAAPTSSYDAAGEKIVGVTSAMEISVDGGAYVAIAMGASSYNLTELIDNIPPNGTLEVKVRRKGVQGTSASLDKVFTIYARTPLMEETIELLPVAEETSEVPPAVEETGGVSAEVLPDGEQS